MLVKRERSFVKRNKRTSMSTTTMFSRSDGGRGLGVVIWRRNRKGVRRDLVKDLGFRYGNSGVGAGIV